MSTISIKIFAGDDVRRTRIAPDATFAAVQGAVQKAFGTTGSLTWVDEDGDAVSIKTDADWNEAVSAFASVVKLNFAPDVIGDDHPTQKQQQRQTAHDARKFAKTPELTVSAAATAPSREPTNADSEAAWVEVEDPAVDDLAAAAARLENETNEADKADEVDKADGLAAAAGRLENETNETDKADEVDKVDGAASAAISETKASTNANADSASGNTTAAHDAAEPDAATGGPAGGGTPNTERSFLATVFKQVAEELEAAAEAEAKGPPVHHGVSCDASGEAPITGTRYHLIHYNYDVNEAEFNQLPKEQQALFEAIARPGDEPVPVGTTTLPHVRAMLATHKAARLERRRREHEEEAKVTQRPHYAWIPAGDDVAPPVKAAYGSRGPGVAQLQHALIAVGAMLPSAIQWRSGVFGPRTTEAVRAYKAKHGIPSAPYEHGTYDEAVHSALVRDVDALVSGNGDDAAAAKNVAATAASGAKVD